MMRIVLTSVKLSDNEWENLKKKSVKKKRS